MREEKEKVFHLGGERNKLEKREDGGEAWASEGHMAFAQIIGSCTFLNNQTQTDFKQMLFFCSVLFPSYKFWNLSFSQTRSHAIFLWHTA